MTTLTKTDVSEISAFFQKAKELDTVVALDYQEFEERILGQMGEDEEIDAAIDFDNSLILNGNDITTFTTNTSDTTDTQYYKYENNYPDNIVYLEQETAVRTTIDGVLYTVDPATGIAEKIQFEEEEVVREYNPKKKRKLII